MDNAILFFLGVVWYTLGAVVICGLGVFLCKRLFVYLMDGGRGRGVGRAMIIGTSILGTPIHELSHALMCLVFGHKITKIALWQPASSDGTLGYVTHTYNRKNPYHILGNLFIGIGPVLGGMGILTLLLTLCFPSTLDTYMAAARGAVESEQPIYALGFPLLLEGLRLLPAMAREAVTGGGVPVWARVLGVVAMLSVSLHIELSPADMKGAVKSLPLYLALALLLTVVCAIVDATAGTAVMASILSALAVFSSLLFALFVIVLAMSLLQVLIALPVFVLRKLFGRKH